jgi:Acetyltransferase (GNAT) domain
MMHIDTLTADDPRWMEALSRLPHDFYHQPSYVRIEARRINAIPEALLVTDNERLLFVPYLLRSCNLLFDEMQEPVFDAVSPYGYPGLLISDAGRNAGFVVQGMAALRETLANRGVCSAFLRMHPILGHDLTSLLPSGSCKDSGQTVALKLDVSEDDILKQMRLGHKRTFKKCKSLGFTSRMVSLIDVFDGFVNLYKETMDRVQATDTYYFDKEYFQNLAHLPGVHCCVVESGSTIAAACIFFECDGIVNAHLGGTRTEFLSNSPFTMVLTEGILWAKSQGNQWVHLGGGVGGREDSLFHFKAGFSDTRFPFLTSRIIINDALYRQMVGFKARATNVPPETVLGTNFFPAYRATL